MKVFVGILIGFVLALSIPFAYAQITEPSAVTFANESVRVWAEDARAFNIKTDALIIEWFGSQSANFPNDSQVVEDGRDAEGVSRLTGIDVNNIITAALAVQTALDGRDAHISKPTVRPLEVN